MKFMKNTNHFLHNNDYESRIDAAKEHNNNVNLQRLLFKQIRHSPASTYEAAESRHGQLNMDDTEPARELVGRADTTTTVMSAYWAIGRDDTTTIASASVGLGRADQTTIASASIALGRADRTTTPAMQGGDDTTTTPAMQERANKI
ncbi:uncharacterized protein LOC111633011 [Centruroides sculpturatus]|uniref:uncharacterized protein LOC111633011 n=1 Tax=Centruroides sculpturatus TaxID=218467 RepID=UPI000C6D4038|nr:uncharacterized protein LOC111633011 [Centruroides sculpturatus]